MYDLASFLSALRPMHDNLCPRQILGVRIGLYAATLLKVDLPQQDKRVFCFIETDGCFTDGVMVATGCSLGHRTMRLIDYGKVAASFIDTLNGCAYRIWPQSTIRETAREYAPNARNTWQAQLIAYQVMPDDQLLCAEPITLVSPLEALISRPGQQVLCYQCGEEIMNGREVLQDGNALCRCCAGNGYYQRTTPCLNLVEEAKL